MNASIDYRAALVQHDAVATALSAFDAYADADARVIAFAVAVTLGGTHCPTAEEWHGVEGSQGGLDLIVTAITAQRKIKAESAEKWIKRACERVAEIREVDQSRAPRWIIPAKPKSTTAAATKKAAQRAAKSAEEQRAEAALKAARAKRKEEEDQRREQIKSARDACIAKIRLIEDSKVLSRIEAQIDRAVKPQAAK